MRALISVSYQLVTTVQWYHASSNSMFPPELNDEASPMEELVTRVVERLLPRVATPVAGGLIGEYR